MAALDPQTAQARLDELESRLVETQAEIASLRLSLEAALDPEPHRGPVEATGDTPGPEFAGPVLSKDDIAALLTTYSAASETDPGISAPTAPVPMPEPAPTPSVTDHREASPPAGAEPAFEISPDVPSEPEALASVPREVAVAALAIPVCVRAGVLHCLVATPWDADALDALRSSAGMPVEPHAVDMATAVARIRATYASEEPAETPSVGLLSRLRNRLPRRAA